MHGRAMEILAAENDGVVQCTTGPPRAEKSFLVVVKIWQAVEVKLI
jgi:hypothetical protein